MCVITLLAHCFPVGISKDTIPKRTSLYFRKKQIQSLYSKLLTFTTLIDRFTS